MKDVVIVDGARTPIGNMGGALKDVTAQDMAATVMKELVKRNNLKASEIDEIILGCVGQFSDAPNVARVAALLAGIPQEATAYTVQRNCSSGMQAVVNAYQNIQCGDADLQFAGGTESNPNGDGRTIATGEYWNGSAWAQQAIALPSGALTDNFQAISCPTTTFCIGVGDYESTAGDTRNFAGEWT